MTDEERSVAEQNAVAREIRHALGYRQPGAARLAVTPALALALAEVAAQAEELKAHGPVLAEVAAERARQIGKGYTAEHDDSAVMGELAQVAGLILLRLNSHEVTLHEADDVAGYILGKYKDDRYRQLIIALAMGAAEAERLERLATREASTPPTTP